MNLIINLVIAFLVFWLVFAFILPLLPEPFHTVAVVFLILAVVYWLFRQPIPPLT